MQQESVQTQKDQSTFDEELQLVSFHIGDEEFAVDILNIQGINRMVEVTKVPNAPEYVEGIINLRGSVIPILDLRRRLGMPARDYDKDTRFIVVEIHNKVLGFIVDSVNEVLRINSNITEPPPPMVSGIDSEFITAVGKLDDRLLILLNIEKVLSKEQAGAIGNFADSVS
jgi:purine-binding chemotaxis protein CheW